MLEIINTEPNAAMKQRLKEIELSKEYSLAKKNNPELFGSMTYDQYKSSLYERVTSLEGEDRYNYISKWRKDIEQAAVTRGQYSQEFRSMYDEFVAEEKSRTTPTTLDDGDEFYVRSALEDYVAHKGKPDEQAFYDRYLERVRRYNELNSVDGKAPPAHYTAPYNAPVPTKPAATPTSHRSGIVTDPSQIPGIENAPVYYYRNNGETSNQYGGMAPNNPDYKTPKRDTGSRKISPVEKQPRMVNVDMLDYSAYSGRSEAISKALLGRKAALMYMSRKSRETAGMPVTDISRR